MSAQDLILEHERYDADAPVNAMSVDVEDYYQVSAFENHVGRDQWGTMPSRVVANTDRILELFSRYEVRATFFTLGCVASRDPGLLRAIVDGGHEVASHGWSHHRATSQDREEFREDIRRTKAALEDIGGVEVKGYRAASYSITLDNLWALDVLQEEGHTYSSSIYPIRHDHYGIPDFPRFAFRLRPGSLLEVPVTTVAAMGRKFPCGGGGWFRALPYGVTRWALRRVNEADRQPAVFYFHPWEVDPHQPRVADLPLKTRFRHYLNLGRVESRLHRLLSEFRWDRMDNIFASQEVNSGERRCA